MGKQYLFYCDISSKFESVWGIDAGGLFAERVQILFNVYSTRSRVISLRKDTEQLEITFPRRPRAAPQSIRRRTCDPGLMGFENIVRSLCD